MQLAHPIGVALTATLLIGAQLEPVGAEKKPAPIEIRLSKQVIMAGPESWTDLTCKVQRDARNRVLRYGIVGYMENSQRQIDGEAAPITFGPFHYTHLPCGAGPAYCMVVRNDGTEDHVTTDIEIAGCDGE